MNCSPAEHAGAGRGIDEARDGVDNYYDDDDDGGKEGRRDERKKERRR